MKKASKEWLNLAFIDLETIRNIISNELLTGVVAFHSQQAIEKSLKAVLEEKEQEIQKTHNLDSLSTQIKEFVELEMDIDILRLLDKLYVESRYPGNWGLLPDGKPSLEDADEFFRTAQNIYVQVESYLTK